MAGQVWRFCFFCFCLFLFSSQAFTLAVVVIVVVDCSHVSFGCLILSFGLAGSLCAIPSFLFQFFFFSIFSCRISFERIVLLSHVHAFPIPTAQHINAHTHTTLRISGSFFLLTISHTSVAAVSYICCYRCCLFVHFQYSKR